MSINANTNTDVYSENAVEEGNETTPLLENVSIEKILTHYDYNISHLPTQYLYF